MPQTGTKTTASLKLHLIKFLWKECFKRIQNWFVIRIFYGSGIKANHLFGEKAYAGPKSETILWFFLRKIEFRGAADILYETNLIPKKD